MVIGCTNDIVDDDTYTRLLLSAAAADLYRSGCWYATAYQQVSTLLAPCSPSA